MSLLPPVCISRILAFAGQLSLADQLCREMRARRHAHRLYTQAFERMLLTAHELRLGFCFDESDPVALLTDVASVVERMAYPQSRPPTRLPYYSASAECDFRAAFEQTLRPRQHFVNATSDAQRRALFVFTKKRRRRYEDRVAYSAVLGYLQHSARTAMAVVY